MAAGAKVGVSAGADRRRCAPLFPPRMSPRISVMFRKRNRCVLTGDSGAVPGLEVGRDADAGHHEFESRSVLGAVKARRFAPPA